MTILRKIGNRILFAIMMIAAIAILLPAAVFSSSNQDRFGGHALNTDVRIFIDGVQIMGYAIDGFVYIFAEDLRHFGFDVTWNEADRALSITMETPAMGVNIVSSPAREPGSMAFPYFYTDVRVFIYGIEITAYSALGHTVIGADDFANAFGASFWDEAARILRIYTNHSITAHPSPTISGTISGAGAVGHGSTIMLSAIPNAGWVFDGWFENDVLVSPHAVWRFPVYHSRHFEARFSRLGRLEVSVFANASPSGGGTILGGGTVYHGSTVTLTAVPNPGWQFVGWIENGVAAGENPSFTLTAMQTRTLTARFEQRVELDLRGIDIDNQRLAAMVNSGEIPANVTHLNLARNPISNVTITSITPLSRLTNLVDLNLWGNDVEDLAPLRYLTNLTHLNLWGNQFRDISALSGLTNLTRLVFGDNLRFNGDITPLRNLTNLTFLGLGSTPANEIVDFSPIARLTRLETLQLVAVSQLRDISFLSNLTNLTSLKITHTAISNFSPIGSLVNLTRLELQHLGIRNLSVIPLGSLRNLEDLRLPLNQISDLRPLSGLTSLTMLTLSHNQITDVSPLANLTSLTALFLDNNPITDIRHLSSLNLQQLVVDGNPIR